MNQTELDPMDAAMDTDWNPTYTIFGQCDIDTYFCVLQKGVGKVLFDAAQHKAADRKTAITITISPLSSRTNANPTERNLIAESKEWASIIKPSLTALQTDLRNINSKWVKAELVANGTYTNKAGETKTSTTIKFLAVYQNEVECQAAADVFFNTPQEGAPQQAVTTSTGTSDRDTALKFLPALWNASGKDVTKFVQLLAGNPLTAKHFDITSPEVVALVAA